jgi:hypothetical protein
MTKQQIAILAALGLAALCVLCFGVYITVSEKNAYRASQAFTSLSPQIATEPPTTAIVPTDKLIPPTPPTTPIPSASTPTPVPLLTATPDIAEPSMVAVTFTGTVTDVDDHHDLLGAGVRVGNLITGTLFYTLGKSDQDPLPHQGHYDFADGEIRFFVQIGEDIFDTGLNGDGHITTMDNHPRTGDYAGFHSHTNIPPSEDTRLRTTVYIEMHDSQPNPDATQSDALPNGFHPADWDRIYLGVNGDREIYYPDYDYTEHQHYWVRADIVSAETSVVPIPVPPTNVPIPPPSTPLLPPSPAASAAPADLILYLRDTNNEQGFSVFPVSGEGINAGTIYTEGATVYGEVAVRIRDTVYHFDPDPESGEPEQLPDPYRLEFEFSASLIAATEGIQPGFNPQKAQFWVGTLDCHSAVPPDRPYKIEMTLYAGGDPPKHTEIRFLVADAPLCGGPPETERIWQPPPTYTPTPLYSPTPMPTPSCDFTIYLRGTNNAEGFATFSGEHVDAGRIYTEGAYVYGEIAVRIGDNEYHYYEEEICPPWRRDDLLLFRVEFKFSDSLLAATKGVQPAFSESSLRFWAGILDCNSATPKPYRIEATLYKDEKIRKHTEINFLVVDDPLCDQP